MTMATPERPPVQDSESTGVASTAVEAGSVAVWHTEAIEGQAVEDRVVQTYIERVASEAGANGRTQEDKALRYQVRKHALLAKQAVLVADQIGLKAALSSYGKSSSADR